MSAGFYHFLCNSMDDYSQGMEVGIVGDLIMSGALAHLDNIHVDWPKYRLSQEDSNKEQGEPVYLRLDEKIEKFRYKYTLTG